MDGNDFMDKLAEYNLGLNPKTDFEIDEEYFTAIEGEAEDL